MRLDSPPPASLDDRLWALARPSPRRSRPTLDRMRQLLQLLGNPQDDLAAVQVGGTSGKGSTCYLLAAMLQAAGYPVGLHSKPHLATVRERLILGDTPIPAAELAALLDTVRPILLGGAWPEGRPTWFELVVALAFLWFRERRARPAVVEVGLGGTWDATSVLQPLVSILTNVGLDHTEILGDTVEAIAADKVGILKTGGIAITGAQQAAVLTIIERRAGQLQMPLWRLGQEIRVRVHAVHDHGAQFDLDLPGASFRDLTIGLLGRHQVDNAALAVAGAVALSGRGFPMAEDALRQGLARCRVPGRLERIAGAPEILLDGAHNPEKMAALAAALRLLAPGMLPVCLAAMRRGHDIAGTLKPLLAVAGTLILTQISAGTDWGREQSVDPDELQQAAKEVASIPTFVEADLAAALEQARTIAGPRGLVCVTGSLYLVGQVRAMLGDPSLPSPSLPLAGESRE
jgi:dihydrofolate synthase/folylpolyglutamate synthase